MRWMHLSDIHLNKDLNRVGSNLLRGRLAPFLKEQNIQVDCLFITGDYRDAATKKYENLREDADRQAENVASYILEIAGVLGLPNENIYLVPGNHDLEREGNEKEKLEGICKSYPKDREALQCNESEYLLDRFAFYERVDQIVHPASFYLQNTKYRSDHHFFPGEECHILCLNTALTCYGDEQEKELLLGLAGLEKEIEKSDKTLPLFVLAHHGLEFLTDHDRETLERISDGRRVYYLCGHSHKMAFHFDDEKNFWKIMVGTTKDAEGAYPVFSIGEVNSLGVLLNLRFYSHQFENGNGWHLHQEYSCNTNLMQFGFIDKKMEEKSNINYRVIKLPLPSTQAASASEIEESLRTLAELKYSLSSMGREQFYLISSNHLSVNAGIIIGYALHSEQRIRLAYKVGNEIFLNSGESVVEFKKKRIVQTVDPEKTVNLCIYIHAKTVEDDSSVFDNYIKKLSNVYKCKLVNYEKYNANINLEKTAADLVKRIMALNSKCKKMGKGVNIHLFYNGFWGLALLLGNQMQQTFPVQLYDYDGGTKSYKKTFTLSSHMF